MNAIVGEAVVSCYADAASLLLMVLLLLLSERIRRRANASLRIFYMLSLCVTAICVFPFIYNAMYMQPAPWCHTVALVAKTLRECFVLVIITLWLIYVDHKLYGDRNRHTLVYRLVFLPFGIFLIILIVNLFTGIAFTYSAENRFVPRPLIYLIFAVEFIYFCSSAVIVRYYDRKTMKIRFLRVSPMIISVLLASGTQFFAPYDIGVIGYVMGLTLLYFSMIGEFRFVDEESGLYNRGYLAYLFDLANAGKNDARSALILEAEGDLRAGFSILRDTLHQSGDVIRVEDRRFLMFSKTDSRSTMQYLSSLLEEAVGKYNAENPEDKIRITARCRMRAGDENAFEFLSTVMDEKESGDTMRGIVSMMSELDRLDKELKLAADIQINMLPMVFPPFPDRKEFDLYASMTPAKEVGGDFYDFFLVDGDHLALVIADVSGKGIPAALFMMVSKVMIQNYAMQGQSPGEVLARANESLCSKNQAEMFVTVWLGVLELSTGRLTAASAGHEYPALKRSGGDFALYKDRHGFVLGGMDGVQYGEYELCLSPGDRLFVYTDGVPEATNAGKELFGTRRMIDALNADPDAGPEQTLKNVRDAVDRFVEGAEQFDDLTMMCLAYKGSPGGESAERAGAGA